MAGAGRNCTCSLNLAAKSSTPYPERNWPDMSRSPGYPTAHNIDSGFNSVSPISAHGGTRVVVPPRTFDPNEMTVIELPNKRNGTFVVPVHDLQINVPMGNNSQLTISTPRSAPEAASVDQSGAAGGCLRPTTCNRMKSELGDDSREDQARLQQALSEALNSCQNTRTFDDVEELLEIHTCNEIQRKLLMLMNEKKEKLRKNEARREAELLERKMDFHKNLIQKITAERSEQSKMHQELLAILESQGKKGGAGEGERDQIEVKISQTCHGSAPPAVDNARGGREGQNITLSYRNPPANNTRGQRDRGRQCTCRSDGRTTDMSDDPMRI